MNIAMNQRIDEDLLQDQHPGKLLLTDRQWDEVGEFLNCTQREKQVCRLLFAGMTRQAIADHLGIKNRTVRHHMEQLHTKMRVNERVGVVLRIVQIRDEISNRSPTASAIPSRAVSGISASGHDPS